MLHMQTLTKCRQYFVDRNQSQLHFITATNIYCDTCIQDTKAAKLPELQEIVLRVKPCQRKFLTTKLKNSIQTQLAS